MILRSQGVSKAHIPVLQCCTHLTHFILKLVQTSCSQFLIISSNQSVSIKNDRPSLKMDITLLFLNQFLNVIYL